MRTLAGGLLLLSLLFVPTGAAAQQPSGQAPAATPAGEADPGVRPVRLIDRDEIRVSRVELQPGAVRRVHAHDDVEYHVWAPVSGSLEITIGNDSPKAAAPGQAFFMKKGTSHGFRNTGTTPAAVFEIFVKKSTTNAAVIMEEDVERLLAGLAAPGDAGR
jgi:quercetin dioxygenase-like cupin family protein